jgi:hypothetical protein
MYAGMMLALIESSMKDTTVQDQSRGISGRFQTSHSGNFSPPSLGCFTAEGQAFRQIWGERGMGCLKLKMKFRQPA